MTLPDRSPDQTEPAPSPAAESGLSLNTWGLMARDVLFTWIAWKILIVVIFVGDGGVLADHLCIREYDWIGLMYGAMIARFRLLT